MTPVSDPTIRKMQIRIAKESDAEEISAIYRPIVEQTATCFEIVAPDAEEFARRLRETLPRFPWLVCTINDQVAGYAYASAHRSRHAYQWSVEVSVYLHSDFRGQRIGKALYQRLFELLKQQGIRNIYAGVTLPNPASVHLHESMGFRKIGVYEQVGFKQGAWRDVGWWHLLLQELENPPKPPIPFERLTVTSAR